LETASDIANASATSRNVVVESSVAGAGTSHPIAAEAKIRRSFQVLLEQDSYVFPATRIRCSSVTKIKIRNWTTGKVELMMEPVLLPFATSAKSVQIKPFSYVNVPITYMPVATGPHEGVVIFKGKNGLTLKASLKGTTIKAATEE
jgi:hypothetical protein